jgi:hypothetical protein
MHASLHRCVHRWTVAVRFAIFLATCTQSRLHGTGANSMSASSNDRRSDVKNPNNPAYEADRANREALGHPNVPPPAQPPTPEPKTKG